MSGYRPLVYGNLPASSSSWLMLVRSFEEKLLFTGIPESVLIFFTSCFAIVVRSYTITLLAKFKAALYGSTSFFSILFTSIPYSWLFIIFSIDFSRSEEHTSELQSRLHLVCRLLLEKKNKN